MIVDDATPSKAIEIKKGAEKPHMLTAVFATTPATIATRPFKNVATAKVRARHSDGNPREICSDTYHASNTLYCRAAAVPDST